METAELIAQLGVFSSSICQVVALLPSLECCRGSCDPTCTKCQIIATKLDLCNTVLTLNNHLYQASDKSMLYPGSVVLAPRLFHGSMCWDVAMITSITRRSDNVDAGTLSKKADEDMTSYRIDRTLSHDIALSVLWIYPQNAYELHATNIQFTCAQIQPPGDALNLLQEQKDAMEVAREGDSILALLTSRDKAPGTWQLMSLGNQALSPSGTVSVKDTTGRYYHRAITEVRMPPRPACNDKMISSCTGSGNGARECGDGDGNSSEDEEQEGVRTLPSYLQQHISRNASSSGLYSTYDRPASTVPVGLWEKHTKGVGSKIMQRMGYRMQAGEGLGKAGQGIAAPIEGLVKALPPGISLDYISGMTKAKPLGQSCGSEDALARRSAEIKMDIVARFNAAQQSGSGGQKAAKRKHTAIVQPVRENDVFGFLNNMEVNKPIPAQGMNSNSRGGGSSSGGSGAASAPRIAAHKTANISKLF